MQTSALKIDALPELWPVIISVISIDQPARPRQVAVCLVEQRRGTQRSVSVCVCVSSWS